MTGVAPPGVPDLTPKPAPSGVHRLALVAQRLRLPRQPLLRNLVLFVLGAAFFYVVTVSVSAYNDFIIGEIALYAIVLAGLSLLTGLNGQISLGHGAFMIIGAYTLALLQLHNDLGIFGDLVVASVVAAAAGVIVGIPAARLSGAYLAGVTLMLALGMPQLTAQYGSVFGGEQGITVLTPVAPQGISTQQWLAWMELFAALVVVLLLSNLTRSRFGRAFRAVRDDEVAAEVSGIHVARTKVLAFAVSAGCAGLGGALLALSTGVVNTGEFPLSLSIGLLAAMVLGGAGSFVGIWWGAIALVYMPQWSTSLSNQLSLGTSAAAYLADAFFGAVLIVAMLVAPTGIQGGLRRLGHWLWGAALGAAGVPATAGPGAGGVAEAAVSEPAEAAVSEPAEAAGPTAATRGAGNPEIGTAGAPAARGEHDQEELADRQEDDTPASGARRSADP